MVDFSHTLYFEGKLEVGLGIRYIVIHHESNIGCRIKGLISFPSEK